MEYQGLYKSSWPVHPLFRCAVAPRS